MKAIVRLLNVEGEALRITIAPQPPSLDNPYQVWEIGEGTLANLLEDLAYAAAKKVRKAT